jgi:hypothetical protein
VIRDAIIPAGRKRQDRALHIRSTRIAAGAEKQINYGGPATEAGLIRRIDRPNGTCSSAQLLSIPAREHRLHGETNCDILVVVSAFCWSQS